MTAFLILFLLPFAGTGIVTAVLAIRAALTGDLGQAGACADARGVRGVGCGAASGMDAVSGGFASAMVVRGDGHLYRRAGA